MSLVNALKSLKLNTRLVLALCFMSAFQVTLIGGFAWYNLSQSLDNEIGLRALSVSKSIAAMPAIVNSVSQRLLPELRELTTRLSKINNTLFIVIGDQNALRLAHPNPAKLGKSMADDEVDNGTPLIQPDAYLTKAEGSLGLSMRARAPIYDSAGTNIIGVVSVGYSLAQINDVIFRYAFWLLAILAIAFIGSALFAVIIARWFKREIFGLEPEHIAQLFTEREATLQSIREGIIAINRAGSITTINRAALKTLKLPADQSFIGKNIHDILPESDLTDVMLTGKPKFDQEVWFNNRQMIANRIPVKQGEVITGAVSSFRPRDELDLVSKKLTRIEQYAESLRSQAHEYSNKLHTIAGLIQLDAKEETLNLIGAETHDHQQLIQWLLHHIPNPVIAGCILGKHNRAKEMGQRLIIDLESSLTELPSTLAVDQLVSVIGNLIDNAIEATRAANSHGGEIHLSLTDMGNDVIIEVQDQGPGIPATQRKTIFSRGYTTKGSQEHGLGLHLVKTIVTQCGGGIQLESLEVGGTRIICYLPKRKQAG